MANTSDALSMPWQVEGAPAQALTAHTHRTPAITGAIAVAAGAICMTGWITDIEALKSIVPGWIVMIPNTATSFMLCGVSLWLLRADQRARRVTIAAQGLAVIVLLLYFFLSAAVMLFGAEVNAVLMRSRGEPIRQDSG